MTVAAACTVRTQYGSGGSSGNGSRRTGRFIDFPPTPTPRTTAAASSAWVLLWPDFPFLPPFPAPREKQRRAEQAGRAAGARTREPPSQFKTRHEGKGP